MKQMKQILAVLLTMATLCGILTVGVSSAGAQEKKRSGDLQTGIPLVVIGTFLRCMPRGPKQTAAAMPSATGFTWPVPACTSISTYYGYRRSGFHIGMTGNTTGPHLHFEVLVNGLAQNPLQYVHAA